jgi:ABC-type lipoprotein export system ATPase subunit
MLCDEPTGNLDSHSAEAVLDVFSQLSRDGLTLAVITHDEHVASRATRRVGIVDGMLRELGTSPPTALRSEAGERLRLAAIAGEAQEINGGSSA